MVCVHIDAPGTILELANDMDTTQKSLLIRIRDRRDDKAWREFHSIYAPFLYRYVRRHGLSHDDAEDVRGHCLEAVSRSIESFDYQRERGGFRNWLRRTALNKIIDLKRKRKAARAETHELEAAVQTSADIDPVWSGEWADARLRYCIERVRSVATETTFHAFHLLVVEGKSVEDVGRLLNLNDNQVYKAKSSILKRLRNEMAAFDARIDE